MFLIDRCKDCFIVVAVFVVFVVVVVVVIVVIVVVIVVIDRKKADHMIQLIKLYSEFRVKLDHAEHQ